MPLLLLGVALGVLTLENEGKVQADPVRIWREAGMSVVRGRVEGFVVFERLGKEHRGIWIQKLGVGKPRCLVREGRYPRIGPDGKVVYFIRGDQSICRISAEGGRVEELLEWFERIPAISIHPKRHDLLFVCSSGVWKINTVNLQVSQIEGTPQRPAAVDVDLHDDVVISTFEGRHHMLWKQQSEHILNSEWLKVDVGCSAAISPQGTYFTDNQNRHECIEVKTFSTNEVIHEVRTYPEIYTVDNEAWTNLDEWLVFNSETRGGRFAWLYKMGDPHAFKCTFTWDSDRPDAYITRVVEPGGEKLVRKKKI